LTRVHRQNRLECPVWCRLDTRKEITRIPFATTISLYGGSGQLRWITPMIHRNSVYVAGGFPVVSPARFDRMVTPGKRQQNQLTLPD
jgi:hypothetical protein